MHVDAITRLQDRRKDVLLTLEHIRQQQCEAEANTEWKDLRAQRRRSELLAELLGWYSAASFASSTMSSAIFRLPPFLPRPRCRR